MKINQLIEQMGLKTINEYHFLCELNGGGSSLNCLYVEETSQKKIVVKFLFAPRSEDERHTFAYEYNLSKMLLVEGSDLPIRKPIFFHEQCDGHLLIAGYEYHDGKLLSNLIGSNGYGFKEGEKGLNLFHQIVTAVSRTSALFIHRDLHPSNILVTDNIDCWEDIDRNSSGIVVLDLGSALFAAEIRPQISEIHSKRLIGSLQSTPPEVFRKNYIQAGKYKEPVYDSWALGNILHKMLLGKLPYEAISLSEIISNFDSNESSYPKPECNDDEFFVKFLLHKLLVHDYKKRISLQMAAKYLYLMRFKKTLVERKKTLDYFLMFEGLDEHYGEPPDVGNDAY